MASTLQVLQLENPNKEYKFSCLKCDKKFTEVPHLETHERTHNGEKVYACAKCDVKFSAPCFLKTHEMLHRNQIHILKCSKCYKNFSNSVPLKVHESLSHRDSCDVSQNTMSGIQVTDVETLKKYAEEM